MSDEKKSVIQQIEQKALQIFELNRQQAVAEENKALLKKSIMALMKEHHMFDHVAPLDEGSDLKISIGSRNTTKVDKEELASDLDISIEGAGKRDVLIKKVEEGKLTFNQYKKYEYEESTETLSVRKVNA